LPGHDTMKFFYSDTYPLPLPEGHRFPVEKYTLLRQGLVSQGLLSEDMLHRSPLVKRDDLLRAHAPGYVDAFEQGALDDKAIRRIGLPWSEAQVTRTHATMGGAVAAARSALEHGLSGQLGGGTHHAHYDYGAGFCVFNDFAIACLHVLSKGLAQRVAIIDLDVHQGDGNAAMLSRRDDVFVFSMHGKNNFPHNKCVSDLDVELDDNCADDVYLSLLQEHLSEVFAFSPDLVLYQCGVDGLEYDRMGRLKLTFDGLMQRDELVLSACYQRGIPVSMGIGGGYAKPITHSVEAYMNTYRVVKRLYF
jgi:acetoin utilization deacetylase AcuC-like enzyme